MEKLKLFFDGNDFVSTFFKEQVDYVDSSIDNCNYIVGSGLPFGTVNKKQVQEVLNKYGTYPKKVILFFVSDFQEKLNIPNNIVFFRTSMLKSKRKENEFVLPYIWEEIKDTASELLPKLNQPIIGFCGNIKHNIGKRFTTIKKFKRDSRFISNFILRQGFWGGKPNDVDYKNEYIDNIKQSHFSICNRGRGNFTIRLYQVLSLGRIPVLIDSDMMFPFENEIDWNQISVRSKSQNQLIEKTFLFWESKGEKEMGESQLLSKDVYENYFSPHGFGKKTTLFLIDYKNHIPTKTIKKTWKFPFFFK
jgi:hypothetical protein